MKNNGVLNEVLKQVRRELNPGSPPGHYTRRLVESSRHSIHAGVTNPGNLPLVAFEFRISSLRKNRLERQTAGLVCEVNRLKNATSPSCRVEIRSTSRAFETMFIELATDLLATVLRTPGDSAAASALSARLDLWQRFLEAGNSSGLSPQRVSGLFGELSFLELALNSGCDPVSVVSSWTGPFGSNQDFMIGTTAIEVKTNCGNDANLVQISNLRQLDTTGLKRLFLFQAAFDRRAGAGRSLPDLVDQLTKELEKVSPEAELQLSTALIASGYLNAHVGDYRDVGFTKRFFKFYQVSGRFPRLAETSVPDGVVAANYTIDLTLAKEWERTINSIPKLYPKYHA